MRNKILISIVIIILLLLPILYVVMDKRSVSSQQLIEIKGKFSIALPKDANKEILPEDNDNYGQYRNETLAVEYHYGEYSTSYELLEQILKEDPKPRKTTEEINGKLAYLYSYDDNDFKFYLRKLVNLYKPSIYPLYSNRRIIFFPNSDRRKILTLYITFYHPKDFIIVDHIISSIKIY